MPADLTSAAPFLRIHGLYYWKIYKPDQTHGADEDVLFQIGVGLISIVLISLHFFGNFQTL